MGPVLQDLIFKEKMKLPICIRNLWISFRYWRQNLFVTSDRIQVLITWLPDRSSRCESFLAFSVLCSSRTATKWNTLENTLIHRPQLPSTIPTFSEPLLCPKPCAGSWMLKENTKTWKLQPQELPIHTEHAGKQTICDMLTKAGYQVFQKFRGCLPSHCLEQSKRN